MTPGLNEFRYGVYMIGAATLLNIVRWLPEGLVTAIIMLLVLGGFGLMMVGKDAYDESQTKDKQDDG